MSSDSVYSDLGRGYNTFKQEVKNKVIDFTILDGQRSTECNVTVCESAEEVANALELSASFGAKAFFGNFDAKAELMNKLCRKTEAVTIIVKAKNVFNASITSARLKDPSASEHAAELIRYAGDSYIESVRTGLEYYAAYQFQSASSVQHSKLTAKAEATVGALSSINASFSETLSKIATETESSYTFSQTLVGTGTNLPDKDDAAAFALKLPSLEVKNPMLLSFKTASYFDLPGAPDSYKNVHAWVQAYTQPGWYSSSLSFVETQAHLVRQRVKAVMALYEFYNGRAAAETLRTADKACADTLSTIAAWKSSFAEQWQSPPKKLEIDVSCLSIPHAKFDIVEGKLSGNAGGGNWWRDVDEFSVYNFCYPRKWEGKGGLVIDQLRSEYGYREASNPLDPHTEHVVCTIHGGDTGSDFVGGHTFDPGAIRYFGAWSYTGQDPKYKQILSEFEVYQKGDEKSYNFGFGSGSTNYNHDVIPDDCFFLGLAGRSAAYIDAIQPLWVRFSAPLWVPIADETF